MTHACAPSILDLGLAGHFATFVATPAGQPAQTQRDSSRRAITTRAPSRTCLNDLGSPRRCPITVTGLAGRISSPLLAGGGPKKIQNTRPAAQRPGPPPGRAPGPSP